MKCTDDVLHFQAQQNMFTPVPPNRLVQPNTDLWSAFGDRGWSPTAKPLRDPSQFEEGFVFSTFGKKLKILFTSSQ